MEHVLKHCNGKNPFSKVHKFYALIELASNSEGDENTERLMDLIQKNEKIILVNKYNNYVGWGPS